MGVCARTVGAVFIAASIIAGQGIFAQSTAEQTVRINSTSPAGFEGLLDGPANDPKLTIKGWLNVPDGARGAPAMLIVHGSSGVTDRGRNYARFFNKMGIATLRIDSYGPRGISKTVGNQSAVTTMMMVADAFASLAFLAADPRIDAKRIGIIGFSKGGGVAFFTAFEPLRRSARIGNLRFALHLPFYRACLYNPEMPLTGAPVREHVGSLDNYTGVDACVAFGKRMRARGADYKVMVYPGAHHSFDSSFGVQKCASCIDVSRCSLRVDRNGRTYDIASGQRLTAKNHRSIMAKCARRGATVGQNKAATQKSRKSLRKFVTQVLNP